MNCFVLFFWLICILGTLPGIAQTLAEYKAKAEALSSKGNYEETLLWMEKVLPQAKKEVGEKHPEYASFLHDMGSLYRKMGRYQQAESIFQEAIAIVQENLGTNHPYYSHFQNSLALLYANMSRYREAELLYQQSMTLLKENLGDKHPYYANSLHGLALLYVNVGRYLEAEPLFKQAIAIKKEILGETHPAYANFIHDLASLYRNMGRYIEAEPLYHQAIAIRKQTSGEKHPYYGNSLHELALLYFNMARYKEAEPLYKQASSIHKEALGEKHPYYANSLQDLALLYFKMLRFREAEPLYQQAAAIHKEALGENHPYYASSIHGLAALYRDLVRYQEAESLYQRAVAIRKEVLGEKHPYYANSLHDLALLYFNMGRYQEAEPLFQQAKAIRKQVLGEKHPYYAYSLYDLASLYRDLGRYQEAESFYHQAIAINKEVLGEKHPNYATNLHNLALLYYDVGRFPEAGALFEQASLIAMEHFQKNSAFLSEQEKAHFQQALSNQLDYFNSFAFEHSRALPHLLHSFYDFQLQNKALLLNETSQLRRRIYHSKDTALVQLFSQWQSQREYLAKVHTLTQQKREQAGINLEGLEQKANELEKELSVHSAAFAKITQLSKTDWQQVQAQLKKGEAAIEMIRLNRYEKHLTDTIHYAALILTPQTKEFPLLVQLNNGNELEEKYAKEYKQVITIKATSQKGNRVGERGIKPVAGRATHQARQAGLYQQYWQPIAQVLNKYNIKKVYFSADGIYHQINLNSLRNPVTKKYVLDEVDLRLVTSTRDLLSQPSFAAAAMFDTKAANKYRAVLVGFPDYNLPASGHVNTVSQQKPITAQLNTHPFITAAISNGALTDLPGTKQEVATIAHLLYGKGWYVDTLLQATALEENIKILQHPTLLHIATHGYFLQDMPQDEDNVNLSIPAQNSLDNPLLRSGLMLAGAEASLKAQQEQQTQQDWQLEDGILTAYEATNLDLEGTELVVLSACETGLGEVKNGEGVYGLQRAFIIAGAQSLLFSLWQVDDQATRQLMVNFYEKWLKGMTKQEALRKAQISLRRKYADPYYWAAFLLIGK